MDMLEPLLSFLLLVLVLGAVWLWGYRSRFKRIPGLARSPERDYFEGLNYLLNDEPDDAVDIFTEALAMHPGTLETHLALSTLLRRRGKVDRAISHCQRLLDSNLFSTEEQHRIRLNLVRSHVAAGLLDRAEHLLGELKRTGPAIREEALELAIALFQTEKEWQFALDAALELLETCPASRRQDLQLQCSHFHCELAEQALGQGDVEQARSCLEQAAGICRSNVRTQFLLARVAAAAGAYQEAVRHLQKIPQYDAAFTAEACAPLVKALQAAGMEQQLQELLDAAGEGPAAASRIPALLPALKARKGAQAVLQLLQLQLRRNPSLMLLAETLELVAATEPGSEVAGQGAAILQQYLQNCAHYRCENCGFELRNLHWLCPGCGKWGEVKPLEGKLPHL